ncbi:MAG: acetyltransferase [Hydrogenovibrio crunogenus]|uniref:Hexapeptide transferase family protein n=1 Tax=Hydrogenovibrio crunogenus (strain DSM 25203 / XCL-2) TaxID=317025 RepID=Q31FM1_HYDCU|nr:acetyltransferase [Hydrogenovibrio crunogenus]
MTKIPVLLIGGGGHCASVIDVIEATEQFEIKGIVEAENAQNTSLLGYPVVGTDEDLDVLLSETPHCVLTVGQVKTAVLRQMLYEKVKRHGGILPTIISPFARVARSAKLGEGCVVMHHALVNSCASIGHNCIINTHALVEHHALVGNHCHISTGAILNGAVEVGNNCLVGSGAILLQDIQVTSQTVLGAGSVVTKSIHESGIYIGNPTKLHRGLKDGE